MGAKQSKSSAEQRPTDGVLLSELREDMYADFLGSADFERTPIKLRQTPAEERKDGLLTNLRRCLFKTIGLGSPTAGRSPRTAQIGCNSTFNLDDTFANLSVEPRTTALLADLRRNANTSADAQLDITPLPLQDAMDPRSPTEGIIRTPLVLNDCIHECVKPACPTVGTPNTQRLLDPRSPSDGIYRTPLVMHEARAAGTLKTPRVELIQITDPRSPSVGIDRTPLVIADEDVEEIGYHVRQNIGARRTLTADLQLTPTSFDDEDSLAIADEADHIEQAAQPAVDDFEAYKQCIDLETDVSSQQSLQVEATPAKESFAPMLSSTEINPIIFNDDDDDDDDEQAAQMLEQVVEKLALELSLDSSVASLASNKVEPQPQNFMRLQHKALERVRRNGRPQRRRLAPRKPPRSTPKQSLLVYEEENKENATCKVQVKQDNKKQETDDGSAKVRTPLGCVKNIEHMRESPIDTTPKMKKSKIPVKRFETHPSAQIKRLDLY